MLTRKYYKAFADIISDIKTEHGTSRAIEHLEQKLREFLAEDNERFDRVRFTEACRPNRFDRRRT